MRFSLIALWAVLIASPASAQMHAVVEPTRVTFMGERSPSLAQQVVQPIVYMRVNFLDRVVQTWPDSTIQSWHNSFANKIRNWSYGQVQSSGAVIWPYVTRQTTGGFRCPTLADFQWADQYLRTQLGAAFDTTWKTVFWDLATSATCSASGYGSIAMIMRSSLFERIATTTWLVQGSDRTYAITGATWVEKVFPSDHTSGSTDSVLGEGYGSPTLHQKIQVGWMNGPGQPWVQTVTTTGTYRFQAIGKAGVDVKGLVIPLPVRVGPANHDRVYLELRNPGNPPVVRVIAAGIGRTTFMVDLDWNPVDAFAVDFNLNPGQVFDIGHIRLTGVSITSDEAYVHVDLTPPCVSAPRTLEVLEWPDVLASESGWRYRTGPASVPLTTLSGTLTTLQAGDGRNCKSPIVTR